MQLSQLFCHKNISLRFGPLPSQYQLCKFLILMLQWFLIELIYRANMSLDFQPAVPMVAVLHR